MFLRRADSESRIHDEMRSNVVVYRELRSTSDAHDRGASQGAAPSQGQLHVPNGLPRMKETRAEGITRARCVDDLREPFEPRTTNKRLEKRRLLSWVSYPDARADGSHRSQLPVENASDSVRRKSLLTTHFDHRDVHYPWVSPLLTHSAVPTSSSLGPHQIP